MDDRFMQNVLTGRAGYSRSAAEQAVRDRLPVVIPASRDHGQITLTYADGTWAERWAPGTGGRRVKVIAPEHGKPGPHHTGKSGWLLEQDFSNGSAVVLLDGEGQPTEISGCCLQLQASGPRGSQAPA